MATKAGHSRFARSHFDEAFGFKCLRPPYAIRPGGEVTVVPYTDDFILSILNSLHDSSQRPICSMLQQDLGRTFRPASSGNSSQPIVLPPVSPMIPISIHSRNAGCKATTTLADSSGRDEDYYVWKAYVPPRLIGDLDATSQIERRNKERKSESADMHPQISPRAMLIGRYESTQKSISPHVAASQSDIKFSTPIITTRRTSLTPRPSGGTESPERSKMSVWRLGQTERIRLSTTGGPGWRRPG
ncbi:hypothetical protein C8F01DRAFT_1087364 [Mycena amicta]|nr:hypothetical protein C8F01DRAFT_1087364 [Mycena amicta]